jgi:acyl carrier protein
VKKGGFISLSENELKLRQAFATGLSMAETDVDESLKYGSGKAWDSVAHMSLIASLDKTFDVMLDIDDVLDLSSYEKAREILVKYGVQF